MRRFKRKFDDWARPKDYARKHYNEAAFLAEYYRWSASRGFSLPGHEPLSGKPRDKQRAYYNVDREEAIAVHKCQAHFWIGEARKLRQYGLV